MAAQPQTAGDFLELLKKSQLLAPSLLNRLLPQIESKRNVIDTAQKLAEVLCKNRVITPYQAQMLLVGRYNGFYIGKYKLLDVLGRGGMGKVFLAEQVSMHRLVAVKVVRSKINRRDAILARFEREARAVASLSHPNIVQAHDFDEINGTPYIVMEYIEGLDVEQIVNRLGVLSSEQAADFIRQAALGLEHAHQRGMVHRDVKPGNLLINTQGVVKLLDLGLVSCVSDTDTHGLTNESDQLGTADYISPEQALNSSKVDIRADIYSLGAVLYFMLSGQVLFPGRSTAQKLLLHQTQTPVPITQLNPNVPAALAQILEKMLAKNPDDRYQTPAEVAAAVSKLARAKVPPYPLKEIGQERKAMQSHLRRSPRASTIDMTPVPPPDSMAGQQKAAAQPAQNPLNRLAEVARAAQRTGPAKPAVPALPRLPDSLPRPITVEEFKPVVPAVSRRGRRSLDWLPWFVLTVALALVGFSVWQFGGDLLPPWDSLTTRIGN